VPSMMSKLLVATMVFTLFNNSLDAAHGSMFVTSNHFGTRQSAEKNCWWCLVEQQQQERHPRTTKRNPSRITPFARKKGKESQDRDRFDVSTYIHAVRDVVVPPTQQPSSAAAAATAAAAPKKSIKRSGRDSSLTKRGGDSQATGTMHSAFVLKDNVPDLKAQLSLSRDGHACIRGLLQPNSIGRLYPVLIEYARQREMEAWRQKVEVAANVDGTSESQHKAAVLANSCQTAGECRRVLSRLMAGGEVPIPFLQFFNCWRDLHDVRDLAERLAPIAAAFLDVKTVRLYQDSVFWKRKCDGPTPWHADARMAPFDTSLMVTAWIPLQNVMSSGLVFASKSHADYSLLYWQQRTTSCHGETSQHVDLSKRYTDVVDYMPLSLGDVTFHAGWTLHCADGGEERLALAITYVDAQAPIRSDLRDGDDEDAWSYRDWISDVPPGTCNWDHPLVPKLGR
jgi:Phytanoyl-CoA dioxygenase (PhyH)